MGFRANTGKSTISKLYCSKHPCAVCDLYVGRTWFILSRQCSKWFHFKCSKLFKLKLNDIKVAPTDSHAAGPAPNVGCALSPNLQFSSSSQTTGYGQTPQEQHCWTKHSTTDGMRTDTCSPEVHSAVKILQWNADGILTKTDEFERFLSKMTSELL